VILHIFQFAKIVCFSNVHLADSSIGQLCEDLNKIAGLRIYYNTIEIQNTKWLLLVNNTVMTTNSNKMLCGSFGVYPSYVVGILNSVKEINFYVLHSEKLNNADCV